ncbi:hypothetical protein P4H25_17695, partial [Paenibacillus larvae]
ILKNYPDVYFVTDTKEDQDKVIIQKQFELIVQAAKRAGDINLLDRIIPELYNEEMLNQVQAIYPFPSYLFSLYLSSYNEDEIVELAKKYDMSTLAMPPERASAEVLYRFRDGYGSTLSWTKSPAPIRSRLYISA